MASEFTQYTTKQGERWDTIAFNAYDNPYGYSPIIAANPQYRNVVVFNESVVLQIPVIETAAEVAVDPASLPPWRR